MRELTLYYADWCPHCVTFKPVWEELKQIISKKHPEIKVYEFESNEISTIEQSSDDPNKQKLERERNLRDGYPTILIAVDGNIERYNDDRTIEKILHTLLKKPKDSNVIEGSFNKDTKVMSYHTVTQNGGGVVENIGEAIASIGGANDVYNKMKYNKYKSKYLELKEKKGIQIGGKKKSRIYKEKNYREKYLKYKMKYINLKDE